MPSEKLRQILRSKSTFTDEEIAAISERDGWAWIYRNSPPKKRRRTDGIEICFTGFGIAAKQELSSLAESMGLHVVTSVTKGLSFLCIGDNPGSSKVQKAQERGVQTITEKQFLNFIETGELPLSQTTRRVEAHENSRRAWGEPAARSCASSVSYNCSR